MFTLGNDEILRVRSGKRGCLGLWSVDWHILSGNRWMGALISLSEIKAFVCCPVKFFSCVSIASFIMNWLKWSSREVRIFQIEKKEKNKWANLLFEKWNGNDCTVLNGEPSKNFSNKSASVWAHLNMDLSSAKQNKILLLWFNFQDCRLHKKRTSCYTENFVTKG